MNILYIKIVNYLSPVKKAVTSTQLVQDVVPDQMDYSNRSFAFRIKADVPSNDSENPGSFFEKTMLLLTER
jgi:hypothetical protein